MPPVPKPDRDANAESSMTLLQRVQAGDQQALDQLIARYRPRLVRWASGRLPPYARDLSETQDLVQDTLISAFRKIEGIETRDEGALQAYLRQAVLNRIRMEIRRVSRKPPGDALTDVHVADMASPLETAVGAEAADRFERALASLDVEARQLIVARVELGFSNGEVARMFGKPSADAARKAIQRALLQLADEMKRP